MYSLHSSFTAMMEEDVVDSKSAQFVQPLFSNEGLMSGELDLDIDFKLLSDYLFTEEGSLASAGYGIEKLIESETKARKKRINLPLTECSMIGRMPVHLLLVSMILLVA